MVRRLDHEWVNRITRKQDTGRQVGSRQRAIGNRQQQSKPKARQQATGNRQQQSKPKARQRATAEQTKSKATGNSRANQSKTEGQQPNSQKPPFPHSRAAPASES